LDKQAIADVLLTGSACLVPALLYAGRRAAPAERSDQKARLIRAWMIVIIVTLAARTLVGLLILAGVRLWAANAFYPFRIASPNYGALRGLPFAAAMIAVAVLIPRGFAWLSQARLKAVFLWAIAFAVSILSGAIHGGLIAGNLGIATEAARRHDAAINPGLATLFATHVERILGNVGPPYAAPHSLSHPAGSIAYWQLTQKVLPPLGFSMLNAAIFALTFPLLYRTLVKRGSDDRAALGLTLIALFTPGLLIYGRSDDAIFYFLAFAALAAFVIAVERRSALMSAIAGAASVIAANLSYAFVVLPAIAFSFPFRTKVSLSSLAQHVRRILPWSLVVLAILVPGLFLEARLFAFNYWEGFRASASSAHAYTFFAILLSGDYVRAFDDRAMTILDFLLLGGPAFLLVYIQLARELRRTSEWPLAPIACFVLFAAIIVQMASAGETARDWGMLFPIMGLCFFPDALRALETQELLWLARFQLTWSLLLLIPIDFGW